MHKYRPGFVYCVSCLARARARVCVCVCVCVFIEHVSELFMQVFLEIVVGICRPSYMSKLGMLCWVYLRVLPR